LFGVHARIPQHYAGARAQRFPDIAG
jgi:hypothetical protein